MNWDKKTKETVYTGLSGAEAEKRLEKYGPNTLEQHSKKSPIILFLGQFKDIMTIILLVCTGVSAFVSTFLVLIYTHFRVYPFLVNIFPVFPVRIHILHKNVFPFC